MKSVTIQTSHTRVGEKSGKEFLKKKNDPVQTKDSYDVIEAKGGQNAKQLNKHPMQLRSNSKLQDSAVLLEKKGEYRKKQEEKRVIRHLVKMVDELGSDLLGGKSLTSSMHLAFEGAMPYVFVQARTQQGDCVYMDGQNFLNEAKRFGGATDELLRGMLSVPMKEMIFVGVVPWRKEGFQCLILDEKSKPGALKENIFIVLLGSSQSDWSRGIVYAQFSTGTGTAKDEKMAKFLFSKATPKEKLCSLDAALVHASHSMSPDLIKFLLREGADPAPCIQSDEFLPLTTAVKAGQMGAVEILLNAGADPRQAASWAHGTAFSWSKEFPEIKRILLDNLKDKNKDSVLRPSYNERWEEYKLINGAWTSDVQMPPRKTDRPRSRNLTQDTP